MYKGKKIIAIIPARAGSKGLPKKNIRPMAGKPLIAWTILNAKKSELLDSVVVSTDSDEIAIISKNFGAEIPYLRPDYLATDSASSVDVVKELLQSLKKLGKEFDCLILLEPTSPLREDGDIDRMIRKLVDNYDHFDSVVTLGEMSEHPIIAKKIIGDSLVPFFDEFCVTQRRQDYPTAYFPYGVGYLIKTESFFGEETFYSKRNTYCLIKKYQCVEIDDLYDFISAEAIMRHEWKIDF